MFITIEGMEGSGKTVVLNSLAQQLQQAGKTVITTREPGASPLGEQLRPILLSMDSKLHPMAELFLFQADRAQHVSQIIKPALDKGAWILCDRYADSTIAYQGYGRGMDCQMLVDMCDLATNGLWPHLTLLLDISPAIGLKRAKGRNEELGLTQAEGRFEAEAMAFHQRVREGFLTRAQACKERFVVLDSAQPLEELTSAAWLTVQERFGL